MRLQLGQLLLERKVISPDQLAAALTHRKRTGTPLGQALVDLGVATPEEILKALSDQLGVPSTRINAYTMDPSAASALPEKVARQHLALPLFRVGNTLTVAIPNPSDLKALDDLRFASGCEINATVALAQEIAPALDRVYGRGLNPSLIDGDGAVVLEETGLEVVRREEEADQSAVHLVEQILARAVGDRASDIHLEPQEHCLRVRLRIDGVLSEVAKLPAGLAPSMTSRIKVLGGMDIAERRLPQDGRMRATVNQRRLDVRISTYPTIWGEKTVLRILDRAGTLLQLEDIGMTSQLLVTYRDITQRSEGIVLITGPTGSGKTTTLYATLSDLRRDGTKNIVTLENPVEYAVEDVNQGQTNEKTGFTFATGLRSILRQDPDIILVGEIRDRQTLEVAIEASLTGHLVLSTLHTNSAVATVTRVVEMGLDPYLIASSVLGIIAQRLVRTICVHCRTAVPTPPELAELFSPPVPKEIARGAGCKECRNTGYRGRTGIYEMLRMTDELRRLVLRRASEEELQEVNRKNGFALLYEEGLKRVREGITTLDEVIRVTQVRV